MKVGMTVSYTHEVGGKRKSEMVHLDRVVENGKAYTDEAFKNEIAERLTREFGAVKPVVVRYEHHGPPTEL
jgi:hypothetical protein